MVYVHPDKCFKGEPETLIRIQIDNALDLGWDRKDILLFTNFDYKYEGVKSYLVSDSNYCPFRPLSTKTITVSNLHLEDDIYWVHDLDAFQLNSFDLSLKKPLGIATYGYIRKWQLGSFFYNPEANYILKDVVKTIFEIRNEDERALMNLTPKYEDKIQKLNNTYNLGYRHLEKVYKMCELPIKVVHFHPNRAFLDFKGILNDRIKEVFKTYGFR